MEYRRLKNIKHNLIESSSIGGRVLLEEIDKTDDYLNNKEKLSEHMEFLSGEFRLAKSEIIILLNKQIADGIQKLSSKGSWANLGRIAEHALKEKQRVLEDESKEDEFYASLVEHTKRILTFMRLSADDQNKALEAVK